jgi:CopG family transcriptional regulator, nickel-responsive regulator
MAVVRFGVSLETHIAESLDLYVKENKFANRSQAIRQLVSKYIVETKWQCNHLVAGTITLVYKVHKKEVALMVFEIVSRNRENILSSQRFLIDNENCMEVVAVKGIAAKLTELSDSLISIKGLEHGKLTMSRVD